MLNLSCEAGLSRPSSKVFPTLSRDQRELSERNLFDRQIEESALALPAKQELPEHLVVRGMHPLVMKFVHTSNVTFLRENSRGTQRQTC